MAAITREGPLLEREAELGVASHRLERAVTGDGGVIAIAGSPGIGKTRMLAALRAAAEGFGMRVLYARGSELERDFAFGVVRQLFEVHVGRAQAQARAELLAGAAGLAEELVSPRARSPVDPTRSEPIAGALHGLYWLTVNVAESAPVLLVVDDAHWADAASLRYLSYLVPRLDSMPVLVALGARPTEPGTELLLATLLADPLVETIDLRPLSEVAVTTLVRGRLGSDAQDALCRACHTASGGNPFLLVQLLHTVEHEGPSPSLATVSMVSAVGPAGVRRAVLARLGRLDEDARLLARAVAVLDGRGSLNLAAEVAGLTDARAVAAADALARAEILRDERPLQFVHPLVRTAVYLDQTTARRSEAHATAARLLTAAGAPADEVAAHVLAVDPRGDRGNVEALREAAALAMRRGALENAVRYLRRALAEPPPPDLVATVLLELGRGLQATDDRETVDTLTRAVAAAIDPQQCAQIAVRATGAMSSVGSHVAAVEVYRAAAARIDGADDETVLRLETEVVMNARMVAGTVPLAIERLEHAETLARPGTRGEALLLAARAHVNTLAGGPAAESIAALERAQQLGLFDEHESGLAFAAAVLPLWNERFDLAIAWCDAGLERESARGAIGAAAGFRQWRSLAELRRGSVADALADASAAHDFIRQFGVKGRATIACLTDALIAHGDLDAAEAVNAGFHYDLPEHVHSAHLIETRGRLRCAQSRLDLGLADLREAGRRWRDLRVEHPGIARWREDAAVALAARGEHAEAVELAEEQLGLARRVGTAGLIGSALRARGLVEQGESGIDLMRQAVATLEQSPARYWHACALVDLGGALRRAGQRQDARAPLGDGLALARRCGALSLAVRAYEELTATGARPRRILRTGVEALTPSERRVARLAASEMSNKEIAQALFVTVRTVETHLSSIYRKLDVTSRADLPPVLRRD